MLLLFDVLCCFSQAKIFSRFFPSIQSTYLQAGKERCNTGTSSPAHAKAATTPASSTTPPSPSPLPPLFLLNRKDKP